MMDAARYATGKTFADFVASAHEYRELWTIGERRAEVPAEIVKQLCGCIDPVRIVVLNEDWCLDAVGSVPYIAKLAQLVPDIDVRIFGRDVNPDLMDAHLTKGGRSIPAAILYDRDWREMGWWGPRPCELQEWVKQTGVDLPKPDRYHYVRQWYARDRGASTLHELADLITAVTSRPGAVMR